MSGAREPGAQVDRLYRAAWALCGSPLGAERLVEQAFRKVGRRGRRMEDGRLVRQLIRGTRRGAPALAGTEGGEPADESGAAVYAAIARLPESLRDAVVAVDVAGLSNPQAAWALNMAEPVLGARLFRGRRELARRLDDAPA